MRRYRRITSRKLHWSDAGRQAARDGLPIEANPYVERFGYGSEGAQAWRRGWKEVNAAITKRKEKVNANTINI